jgi:hypothetical protein
MNARSTLLDQNRPWRVCQALKGSRKEPAWYNLLSFFQVDFFYIPTDMGFPLSCLRRVQSFDGAWARFIVIAIKKTPCRPSPEAWLFHSAKSVVTPNNTLFVFCQPITFAGSSLIFFSACFSCTWENVPLFFFYRFPALFFPAAFLSRVIWMHPPGHCFSKFPSLPGGKRRPIYRT